MTFSEVLQKRYKRQRMSRSYASTLHAHIPATTSRRDGEDLDSIVKSQPLAREDQGTGTNTPPARGAQHLSDAYKIITYLILARIASGILRSYLAETTRTQTSWMCASIEPPMSKKIGVPALVIAACVQRVAPVFVERARRS